MKEVKYCLPLKKALRRIMEFNDGLTYMATDYLIAMHFQNLNKSLDPAMIGAGVILLDSLWNTNLRFADDDTNKIIRELSRKSVWLKKELMHLGREDLRLNPHKIVKMARRVFGVILDAKGVKLQHYSFATKFFHWCTRRHFPIMDSMARKAINRFEKSCGAGHCRIPKFEIDEEHLDDYERWIYFYSKLMNSIRDADIAALLKADSRSRHSQLVQKNSLLRVLDKIFYIEGSEME